MDYDEIMRNLEYTIKEHKDKFVGTFETNIYDMARDCKRYIEWQQKEIEALKPQPDMETGLMPCGCGGKARIEESPFADDVDNIGLKIYTVGCTDCTIGFEGYFTSNEDAQEHWNGAMGWKESKL